MAQGTTALRLLVLGANGKLGRLLRAAWQGLDTTLDILPVSRDGSCGLAWQPEASPDRLPKSDRVLALWGVTPVHGGPFSHNTALAMRAMEVAQAVGADRVLQCSSAAVYAPGPHALREDDDLAPTGDYGAAKRDMERALALWHDSRPTGPKPVVLRIGNVAGAESLSASISRGGPVTLESFADSRGPERSYVGPSDLARVIEALCRCPVADLHPVYNVAAPEPTAMADLARAAGRQVIWRNAPPGAVQRVALDTARLQEVCPLPSRSFDAEWLIADWQRWSGAR